MRWRPKQVKDAIEYAKAGLTSFEIADRLSKDYGVKITSSSVRNELNRRHVSLHHRRWNADGVQTSTTILKVVKGQYMTPDDVIKAHGYDPKQWKLVSNISNFWKSTEQVTNFQSKITVKPRVGLSRKEISGIAKDIKPHVYSLSKDLHANNLVIPLPDLHFGWTAYEDVVDKVEQLQSIIKHGYGEIVIEQLGDMFHSDQVHSSQTVAGTLLDHANMRQAFKDALQLFSDIIPLCIKNSKQVYLKSVFGNHSGDLEYAFLYTLRATYPQLKVDLNDDNPSSDWRTAYQIGHVGIMMTHGDVARNKLLGLFPTEYRQIWGNVKTAELHSGHYHSERFKDSQGIMWRQLGTAKPNDPYEIKNGFTNGKHLLYAFVYDDERLREMYEL